MSFKEINKLIKECEKLLGKKTTLKDGKNKTYTEEDRKVIMEAILAEQERKLKCLK